MNADYTGGSLIQIDADKLDKSPLRLVARPCLPLTVRTVDSQGRPLRGARVSFGSALEMFSHSITTDSKGEAHPTPVVRGAVYRYSARLDGFYSGQYLQNLPAAGSKEWKDVVTIVMSEAHRTQKGKVIDKDGKPVANARVYLYYPNAAMTDAAGAFALPGLPDQEVAIRALTADGAEGTAKVSKDTGDVTITLRRWE